MIKGKNSQLCRNTKIKNSVVLGSSVFLDEQEKDRGWLVCPKTIEKCTIVSAAMGGRIVNICPPFIKDTVAIGFSATENTQLCWPSHLSNSLLIGASDRDESIFGGAEGTIDKSIIIGATRGNGSNVVLSKKISDSLIIGSTEGEMASVASNFPVPKLENSLVIGSTIGKDASVSKFWANAEFVNSMVVKFEEIGMEERPVTDDTARAEYGPKMNAMTLAAVHGLGSGLSINKDGKLMGGGPQAKNVLFVDLKEGRIDLYDKDGEQTVKRLDLQKYSEFFTKQLDFLRSDDFFPRHLIKNDKLFTDEIKVPHLPLAKKINLSEWNEILLNAENYKEDNEEDPFEDIKETAELLKKSKTVEIAGKKFDFSKVLTYNDYCNILIGKNYVTDMIAKCENLVEEIIPKFQDTFNSIKEKVGGVLTHQHDLNKE